MKKDKSPVKLREKKLKNGNISLYLDIYANGVRRYEFLKLYIIPETSKLDKERNRVTIMQAEAQRAKCIIDIQNGRFGRVCDSLFSKVKLTDQIDAKANAVHNKSRYAPLKSEIIKFGDILLQNINKNYILKFIEHIREKTAFCMGGSKIKESTINAYYRNLSAVINMAVRDGIIAKNPCAEINPKDKPRPGAPRFGYLTIEEVKRLQMTFCKKPHVKRAFLLSCYTGLRVSDIRELTYKDIKHTENGLQIVKEQIKTGEVVYIPLNEAALKIIGDVPKDEKSKSRCIFRLPDTKGINRAISSWCKAANIDKHVTYHTSRHTAATLLISFGADIYTTSKLLGHTSVKTTQIYAEVVNAKKVDAINKIPNIFEM